jgi:DNA-directed RNA polymerase subunit RPC12/RpoP
VAPDLVPKKSAIFTKKIVHSNGQVFKCSKCDEKFLQFKKMIAHKKRVHTLTQFKCSQCSHETKHLESIKKHELRHIGNKSFHCL